MLSEATGDAAGGGEGSTSGDRCSEAELEPISSAAFGSTFDTLTLGAKPPPEHEPGALELTSGDEDGVPATTSWRPSPLSANASASQESWAGIRELGRKHTGGGIEPNVCGDRSGITRGEHDMEVRCASGCELPEACELVLDGVFLTLPSFFSARCRDRFRLRPVGPPPSPSPPSASQKASVPSGSSSSAAACEASVEWLSEACGVAGKRGSRGSFVNSHSPAKSHCLASR